MRYCTEQYYWHYNQRYSVRVAQRFPVNPRILQMGGGLDGHVEEGKPLVVGGRQVPRARVELD